MYLTASQMNHVTTLKCTKKKVGDLSNFRKQYLTAHYKKNSKIKQKYCLQTLYCRGIFLHLMYKAWLKYSINDH